jgi:hypothetical protein
MTTPHTHELATPQKIRGYVDAPLRTSKDGTRDGS